MVLSGRPRNLPLLEADQVLRMHLADLLAGPTEVDPCLRKDNSLLLWMSEVRTMRELSEMLT